MLYVYFRTADIDVSVKCLLNFCINKNKIVISIEVDKMLIKGLHQEEGYDSNSYVLAEFLNKAFELIPMWCSLCWKLVFSVSSK